MRNLKLRFLVGSFVVIFLSGCFGSIPKQGSVIGMKGDVVKTQGGAFRVAPLPSEWRQKKIKYRAVLFVNSTDQSTITIDSWCQGAYSDASIEILTEQLVRGIDRFKILHRQRISLSGREALKIEGHGEVDGKQIFISAYVLNMNHCVYDFVYVSTPAQTDSYGDFEEMVQGFQYLKGPSVL